MTSMATGVVDAGPVGTPLPPTDAEFFGTHGMLDSGLHQVGYLTEDGVTVQVPSLRRKLLSRRKYRFKGPYTVTFTVLGEVDAAAFKAPLSWVFRVIEDGGRKGLIVPVGSVDEDRLHETRFTEDDVASTEITIKARPDANGVSVYLMTDQG